MSLDDHIEGKTHGKMVTVFDVGRTGRYATHHSLDGHLYEYDLGRFWRTNLLKHESNREPVNDPFAIPLGPWYHLPECGCEVCEEG